MHDMLCSSLLVDFLGFKTEFQSISGRLIGDMEALHCVSYPFLLFLTHIWCEQQRLISDFADVLDASFCLRKLVCTVVYLYAEVGQKKLIKQCRPSQTAHTEAV